MTTEIAGPARKVSGRNVLAWWIIAAVVLVIFLWLVRIAAEVLVDWLWFSSVGYLQVFWTSLAAEAAVFGSVFIATAVILWLNGWFAVRFARRQSTETAAASVWQATGNAPPPNLFALMRDRLPWPRIVAGGAALIALLVAAVEAGNWGVFLRFLYHVPYGADDPLYNKDIGFYLFALPAYILVKNWMLLALVLSALFAGTIYWVHGDIEHDIHQRSMSPTVIAHGSALLGLLFAVNAWSYGLDRYLLLYGDNGVVVGASYTDIHVGLPGLWLLIGLSIIAALTAFANLRVRTYRLPAAALIVVGIGSFVLSGVAPGLFRHFFVKPSELELEEPYLVISNGRIFWMQDAYTTSSYFPSAQPAQDLDLNYIRNSVKAIVDAYNGTVDFYLMDPGDPIAATYQRIFPNLFKPFTAMPPDLQMHIRYPEDMFLIQARLYQTYHMEAADVFYNREDLWQFPRQPGGGGVSMMSPYYIIMRLPAEPQAEFFLMLPMVPSRRDNMIAWLAARCDAPDYGKLIVYEFPKEKLVYGPFQIEARINQSTEISQQITLWNQMGSRVIRGANLLVIPIENSILYVSPLYLRAEHGHLPELKRVIAAYGEHVVMKDTLAEALSALFIEPGAAPAVSSTTEEVPLTGPAASQAREALDRYNQAVERLKSGDWKGFGTQFDAMRELLEKMNRQSNGR
jgi:uncharacterized membrane protein (UPF0182 family)